jgi:Cu-Zn family superoxide dismutase
MKTPSSTAHRRLRRTTACIAAAGAVATSIAAASVAAGDTPSQPAVHATATLVDITGASIGTARFVEDAAGLLHINVKVAGLTPGLHGVHIHEAGSCTPTFTAAGAHHNPLGAAHGSHAGDLPNLVVNGAGRGRLNASTEQATLSAGPVSVFDLDGSSLIIHAAADDLVTQPTGNSGARVACGVIVQ